MVLSSTVVLFSVSAALAAWAPLSGGSMRSPSRQVASARRAALHAGPKRRSFAKEAKFRTCCYGCGADLQFQDSASAGYVEPERYEGKAVHKQLRLLLCCRCRALTHGEILPAVVEGRLRGADAPGSGVTTPEELRAELKALREQKCLVVLLVDVTDVTGSFLPRVRDLVGGNPIVLVGTKVDLLPKGTDIDAVGQWLAERLSPRLNVIAVHLVSARTGDGVQDSARTVLGERKGRNLFIVGAANVGKSLYVGALLEHIAGGRWKRMPISSATPGTTLRVIGVDCFDGASQLFDTPGVHLHHRLSAQLLPSELKAILPRGRMRPYTPLPTAGPLHGHALFWGGLVRVDVLEAPPCMRLTFVTAFDLHVTRGPLVDEASAFFDVEVGRTLTPPLDRTSAAQLGALELSREVEVQLTQMQQTSDICISGLGWISVGALASLRSSAPMRATLAVWAPKGVLVSVRPPMPVAGLANKVMATQQASKFESDFT